MVANSSTSSSERGRRPLRTWPLVVALVLVAAVLEAPLQRRERALAPLFDRLDSAAVHSMDGERTVLIMGACVPSQMLRVEVVGDAIGPDARVFDLAAPSAFTMDWSLLVANELPEDSSVEAIVVAYHPRDLLLVAYMRESAMFQLAHWKDLPLLASSGCADLDCAADVGLKFVSTAYRQRDRAGLAVWSWLRGDRSGSGTLLRRAEGVGRELPMATPFTDPGAERERLRSGRADRLSPREVAAREGAPVREPDDFASQQGWQNAVGWHGTAEAAAACLDRMVAEARARGIRVLFVPLPRNPEAVALAIKPDERDDLAATYAAIETAGGELMGAVGTGVLSPDDFKDDVHASPAGRSRISSLMGQAIAAQLDVPAPPVAGDR
jgi:hypothetical protein